MSFQTPQNSPVGAVQSMTRNCIANLINPSLSSCINYPSSAIEGWYQTLTAAIP